jgi:hypothetical protein|tara:strand:- start:1166 stop:1294 length:129 start_codon:yes stop_codon:yes gene_type:complete
MVGCNFKTWNHEEEPDDIEKRKENLTLTVLYQSVRKEADLMT